MSYQHMTLLINKNLFIRIISVVLAVIVLCSILQRWNSRPKIAVNSPRTEFRHTNVRKSDGKLHLETLESLIDEDDALQDVNFDEYLKKREKDEREWGDVMNKSKGESSQRWDMFDEETSE